MKVDTKFNVGDEVAYDTSKVGTIIGIEILVRLSKQNRKRIKISYVIKANNIIDQTKLNLKGALRGENKIQKRF